MEKPAIPNSLRAASPQQRHLETDHAASSPVASPLRISVLYTKGQGLEGTAEDDLMLMHALEAGGMDAESIDLAHLSCDRAGVFSLTDPENSVVRTWSLPDAALMYHGALAPKNSGWLLDQMEDGGCSVVNGHEAWRTMTDKWRFFQNMEAAGVPTISTLLIESPADALEAVNRFGLPAVFKAAIGTEGDGVHIVSDKYTLRRWVSERLDSYACHVIAQPFVESRIDASLEPRILERVGRDSIGMRCDFRVMTVAREGASLIVAAFARVAVNRDQTINNVAKGSREVPMDFGDLHPADQETVRRAVAALPAAQVVGWDLIGRPGHRVIMEANSGPGLPCMPRGTLSDLMLAPATELVRDCATRARTARGVL